MRGIIGYGAYIPFYRLQREAISEALGSGGGRGSRAVASYDEDSVSMAVEACRNLIRTSASATTDSPGSAFAPASLSFCSATPPYLDKSNATAIHAALRLNSAVFAADIGGAPRSVNAALRFALEGSSPALIVASDIRTGRPGSVDEAAGGDGAVAWLIGSDEDGPVLAEWLGGASATAEFLDRWRLPGWNYSRVWEERFGEHAYVPLVEEASSAAFEQCQIQPADVGVVVIAGLHARAARGAARAAGLDCRVADDLSMTVGNTGSAQAGMTLASILDESEPDQTIMVIHLADGCDVGFYRTTDAIASYGSSESVQDQIDRGSSSLDYSKFLTWRGFLDREPPRRPDPQPPAAPPSQRNQDWKYAFVGSRDRSSGAIHLPPHRVSVKGGAVDEMDPVPMAEVKATVATFTIDRLAYTLSPPAVAVVIDFDGGGRFSCQLTDVDPDSVAIGDRVRMTFRCMRTDDGVHNYFWKAKPDRSASVPTAAASAATRGES